MTRLQAGFFRLHQTNLPATELVEGGAIDWASHANQQGRTIEGQVAYVDNAELGQLILQVME